MGVVVVGWGKGEVGGGVFWSDGEGTLEKRTEKPGRNQGAPKENTGENLERNVGDFRETTRKSERNVLQTTPT